MRSSPFIDVAIRAAFSALAAAATLAAPLTAAAQQPPAAPAPPQAGASTFVIFARGVSVGTEQIAVTRDADGWKISSTGRLTAPIDVVSRKLEVRYTGEWQPLEFTFDGTVRGQPQSVHTIVDRTAARSDISSAGQPSQRTETIDANATLVLVNSFFGPYEALAARLKTAAPGTHVPIYGVPAISFMARVGESNAEQIQTAGRTIAARRTKITLQFPNTPLDAELWADEAGRMIRFSIPAQGIDVARDDIAAVSSRRVTISRTNDEQVNIPSNGFQLAATLSKPVMTTTTAAANRRPAVVLVGGSGPTDRDELAFGIPIFGQIAGALADAGFIVVRYDKRGIGQSGGRPESAGLADYADDLRSAVLLLSKRKDVDPKRIAVVGHSEGGTVALMAASKDKRIAALALVATPGISGVDLILAQQQHVLGRSLLSVEEKQAKVDAQKRIHEAVLTGKGMEKLPTEVRRAVDNAEFRSLLASDPAKIMNDVPQPILIVQGELDTQVEPMNADRLETLARKRKKAPAVEVVKVPGVNHLLAQATTGEVDEYGTLKDKRVSQTVTQALVTWLQKTLIVR